MSKKYATISMLEQLARAELDSKQWPIDRRGRIALWVIRYIVEGETAKISFDGDDHVHLDWYELKQVAVLIHWLHEHYVGDLEAFEGAVERLEELLAQERYRVDTTPAFH